MALFQLPRVFIQSLAEEAEGDVDLGNVDILSQQGIGHAEALVGLGEHSVPRALGRWNRVSERF
jgi:hypothetical protein